MIKKVKKFFFLEPYEEFREVYFKTKGNVKDNSSLILQ